MLVILAQLHFIVQETVGKFLSLLAGAGVKSLNDLESFLISEGVLGFIIKSLRNIVILTKEAFDE